MATLLSLETSTHVFSCALHQGEELISAYEHPEGQATASLLTVRVEKLFTDAGINKNELNAVVVASGPGSYTGLRIGVATAKGICFALNIPLVSVNTLSLLAQQFVDQFPEEDLKEALICPMLDARRMEVYCMLCDREGHIVEQTQAKVIDAQSFATQLDRKNIYFLGDGADKCKELIHHPNARFVSGMRPSASTLGPMGFKKYERNECEDLGLFEPLYLKDFVVKKPKLIS